MSQHQELLLEQIAKGPQVQARSWKTLEHLQSDQMDRVHTLEVSSTEAHDAQKEEPYLLRSDVCAGLLQGVCVVEVKQSSATLNLAKIG